MDYISLLEELYIEKLQSALERIQACIGDKGTVELYHITIPRSDTTKSDRT